MGADYFLFIALNIVKGISYDRDLSQKIQEIREETARLKVDDL